MIPPKNSHSFPLGHYRPIYLWGGPGTIRMNRLKFLEAPVNEAAHRLAHEEAGARLVVQEMACNWVHLTYDWGFPPEVEQEDWEAFARAAEVYHRLGSPVLAYLQTSNYVCSGSFREKDWAARDPHGRPITYFTYGGRHMACFGNPDWEAHLREMALGALQRGADGLFFDNLFHGGQPLSMFGAWLGSAGCYCPRCQAAFRQETGWELPLDLNLTDERTRTYLRWRVEQVCGLLRRLVEAARRVQPQVVIAANDFDPVLRNSYLIYGIDLEKLAEIQDITMIENYGLPLWEGERQPKRLANNALTLRTARRLVGDRAHLSVLSYDVGIGFDDVYPVRRYRQGMAEASALGVSMTTKGTEYFDGQQMTLLLEPRHAEIRKAIGEFNRWLQAQAELYAPPRRNRAPIGLLFPGEALWLRWAALAPIYFGAGQALTAAGLPWRVVYPQEAWDDLQALLTLEPLPEGQKAAPKVIHLPALPGWQRPGPAWWVAGPQRRRLVGRFLQGLMGLYSSRKWMRSLSDRLGLQKIVTQSPWYFLPEAAQREALLRALPLERLAPRLQAEQPVLIEFWERDGERQIHLVNYAAQPQEVLLWLGEAIGDGRLISPDQPDQTINGNDPLRLRLDTYAVLCYVSAPSAGRRL